VERGSIKGMNAENTSPRKNADGKNIEDFGGMESSNYEENSISENGKDGAKDCPYLVRGGTQLGD